jgi:hypothetical protein
MIRHDKIAKHPRLFKTLTGLSTEGFRQLLPAFERAWEAELDRRDAGQRQRRRRGGGRKGCLAGTADKRVFVLVYFRLYPIQAVQGLLFGMGQPQANDGFTASPRSSTPHWVLSSSFRPASPVSLQRCAGRVRGAGVHHRWGGAPHPAS